MLISCSCTTFQISSSGIWKEIKADDEDLILSSRFFCNISKPQLLNVFSDLKVMHIVLACCSYPFRKKGGQKNNKKDEKHKSPLLSLSAYSRPTGTFYNSSLSNWRTKMKKEKWKLKMKEKKQVFLFICVCIVDYNRPSVLKKKKKTEQSTLNSLS